MWIDFKCFYIRSLTTFIDVQVCDSIVFEFFHLIYQPLKCFKWSSQMKSYRFGFQYSLQNQNITNKMRSQLFSFIYFIQFNLSYLFFTIFRFNSSHVLKFRMNTETHILIRWLSVKVMLSIAIGNMHFSDVVRYKPPTVKIVDRQINIYFYFNWVSFSWNSLGFISFQRIHENMNKNETEIIQFVFEHK